MKYSLLVALLACSASYVAAQDPCYRPAIELPPVLNSDPDDLVCAPKENLPADASRGFVHTRQLVHSAWIGIDENNVGTLYYRRSLSGGCDWEPTQVLWQEAAGESGIDGDFRLVCCGHEVWIIFTTNRLSGGLPDPTGNDHVWVLGSEMQGQAGSFQQIHVSNGQEAALSTNDLGADVDGPEACCKSGSLHLVFEYDYQLTAGTATPSNLEDAFYQRVDFVQGSLVLALPEEVRMESTPSGTVDTDSPGITCLGDVVVVWWQDSRSDPLGDDNAWNDTIIRVSKDCGVTFGGEQNLTEFPAPLTFANPRPSFCCLVDVAPLPRLLVFFEDSRNTIDDDIFMRLSPQCGDVGTFLDAVTVSQSPVGVDSDGMNVCCTPEGAIYVTYEDNRQNPSSNANNLTYVVADPNSGSNFLSGTQVETVISAGNAAGRRMDCYGNDAVISFVDGIPGNDPATIAYTSNGGATWTNCRLFDETAIDADADVGIALTTGGDMVATWIDDRLGANQLFAGGARVMQLTYDPSTLVFTATCAGDPGNLTVMLPAVAPTACRGTELGDGWQNNFVQDVVTFAAAASLPTFLALVDSANNSTLVLPNFATILGPPLNWTAVTFDSTGRVRAMADVFVQNP